jgi:beta-barrel assembly-enhancing protease
MRKRNLRKESRKPGYGISDHMKERSAVSRFLAVLLVILMAQPAWMGAAQKTPELPDPGSVPISKQQQEQLGLKAAGEVYQQMPVLPDSHPVSRYVQALGKKLAQVIPAQTSWPYQFHVIQQKDINAFALPGGPIFVNVGTITAAQSEAQLAGVMAHEMSHVYMQHSIKGMQKQQMTQGLAGIVGGILGSVLGGSAGALANMGAQLGGGMLSLRYSRKDEAQADAVGAIIMYKVGYNPQAMAQFFQALEKSGGPGGPQFLSDHPNPGNRVEAVDKEIAEWPQRAYAAGTAQFPSARQQAATVHAYTAQEIAQGAKSGTWAQQNRKNGAIPANVPVGSNGQAGAGGEVMNVSYQDVRPSGSYRQFSQNGISIEYPSNWQPVGGQNGLTIAPPAGVSQGAIAYGAMIGSGQDQNASSLDQATQDLVQSLQQSNPGMQQSGGMKSVKVNGTSGRSVTLMGNSPVQQGGKALRERDWLVTLPDPQGRGLIYLVFISPDNTFGQMRGTYEHMLNSFRVQ